MAHAGWVSARSVEVARPPSAVEAHLIVGMLEANGIGARASADDAGGLEPQWQLTGGVRVLVAPEDAGAARRLVAEAEPGLG
jgi:Putative prokaryotic signal transducing protein